MRSLKSMILAAAVMGVATAAQAATITYVDATTSNTVQAASTSGAVGSSTATPTWTYRSGYGMKNTVTTVPTDTTTLTSDVGGDVWQAWGSDYPRLATSVTGLANGTYEVYAYFWDNGSYWRIGAGLSDTATPLTVYTAQATDANAAKITQIGVDGNRPLHQVDLGSVSVTNGSIKVFIEDDYPKSIDNGYRTWYDGIGYATAVPEPASLGLLGVGTLLTLRRRRA